MTNDKEDQAVKGIFKAYAEGGSMATNFIRYELEELKRTNPELAQATYERLEKLGY